MRALFLYTELADYFLKCCEQLSAHCEVHIVRWPVNKEAPFDFKFAANLTVYNRQDFTRQQLKDLAAKLDPDVIVCSGWIDKDYLAVARSFFKKVPTVMSCDTKWKGSLRQWAAVVLSRITLRQIFSHAWVPGPKQRKYVKKLGFGPSRILEGFYTCDLDRFNQFYRNKNKTLSHRFIFAGRYYSFKGITDLWDAFIGLHQSGESNDWELWCLGSGDIKPVEHPRIRHFGFVQPADLEPILNGCSVFVLPSRIEPWGVVVHEFAAAGFPLILSKETGAADAFLAEGENGFSFSAGDVTGLKAALKKVINLNPKQLLSMSEHSHRLAQRISPAKWTETLLNVMYEGKKK